MKFPKLIHRAPFKLPDLSTCLDLLGILLFSAGFFIWSSGSAYSEQAPTAPGRPITEPSEIATLDNEFGDLTDFGYSSDIVYKREDLVSNQMEAGRGPLHDVRGHHLLVGKTGLVADVVYRTKTDDGFRLYLEPENGAELCLRLLEGYTAPQEWWNRPVVSIWQENADFDGHSFSELSVWAPWPDPIDEGYTAGRERQAPGWYWDGATYVRTNQFTTLVVNDDRLDFALLAKPSP